MMELEQILTYCDHTLLKPEAKASEIRKLCDEAIRFNCASVCIPPCHVAGARRVNLSMVKDGCWAEVANDIRSVRAASEGAVLKVIIECCKLTDEEKIRLCQIVSDCGADYIKTSTGFAGGGATPEDVALMRANAPASLKIKAAGGISSVEDAAQYLTLGCSRLGTSRLVKLALEREEAEKTEENAENTPET